jgi:hypothetical protein
MFAIAVNSEDKFCDGIVSEFLVAEAHNILLKI